MTEDIDGDETERGGDMALVDRNPMLNKFKSPKEHEGTELAQLTGIDFIKNIFMSAVPFEKRRKIDQNTDGLMLKARFLPPRLSDELVVHRTVVKELHEEHRTSTSSESGDNQIIRKFKDGEDLFSDSSSSPGSSLLNIDKKRRFAMSLATLASKPHKRPIIVREGAIHVLSLLSNNPDEVVQRCCSAAFSFLTLEPTARKKMVEDSAPGALTKLVMSSNQNIVVKHNCCRAICNLALEVGSESRLVKDGLLASLMNIISYCPETVDICLMTLFNMSCVADRFARIEEMTEVLLRLSVFLTYRAQEALYLNVLCNLSAIRGNQLRMVEDGVQRIVDGVFKSTDVEMRTTGAIIFSNFCTDNRAKVKMVEHGAIRTMINMMEDESEEIRNLAVRVYYSLAKDQQLRPKLFYNEKATSLLLRMGTDDYLDTSYGQGIARVYRMLSREIPICSRLVNGGMVQCLRYLLERDDAVIRHRCTETLCTLFELDDVVGDLVHSYGAVEVLINLAVYANFEHVQDGVVMEWTMYTLYRLCLRGLCSVRMLQMQVRVACAGDCMCLCLLLVLVLMFAGAGVGVGCLFFLS
jgi:hypothetical protein